MNDKQPVQKSEFRSPVWQNDPDDEIAKRARSLLRWKVRYDSIQVKAEKGHVTLLGEVNFDSDREAAAYTVRKLSGVVGVTNMIATKVCITTKVCAVSQLEHASSYSAAPGLSEF